MTKVEVSRVIKAPRKKVWEVVSDPTLLPKFMGPDLKSVEVLSRVGNTITYKTTSTMGGREVKTTNKYTLHPPDRVEDEILEGPMNWRGTTILEEVPEGTKYNWSGDISFKGVLGRILGRLFAGSKLQEGAEETTDKMAKYVEAQLAETQ